MWSVYSPEGRLVLAMSDEPGEYNFARLPPRDAEPVFVPYATLQCYDSKRESEILGLVTSSRYADELLERLQDAGYRVAAGRPKTGRFARL